MRRVASYLSAGLFSLAALLYALAPLSIVTAQTPTTHLWDGQLSFEDLGTISESLTTQDPNCEIMTVVEKEVYGPTGFSGTIADLIEQFNSSEVRPNQCITRNSHGAFNSPGRYGKKLYSPTGSINNFWELESMLPSPAPAGEHVLLQDWQYPFSTEYRLHHTTTFIESTNLHRRGVQAIHKHNGVQTALKLSNGENYTAKLHSFSSNGRYVAVHSRGWIHKIDLDTLRLTPVKYVGSGKIDSLSVDRSGQYLSIQTSNKLTVIDSENCENSYGFGAWNEQAVPGFSTTPGCVESSDLLVEAHNNGVINIYSGNANRQYRRAYFDLVGDTIKFAFGEKFSGEPDYSWREIAITADDYISTAEGYLAMGDSFASGEGDLEGGEWYEPGTDEQGDKSTFAGRNLCHLSRRSYPYLIATELGYLSSPSTPQADSLFHSVACSGAKIHNIVGGTGVFEGDGDASAFEETDNQYRTFENSALGYYQPGNKKQLSHLLFHEASSAQLVPEVITFGIGGNDVGFAENLMSCILSVGTCPQAVPGSPEQKALIVDIAFSKNDLRSTYDDLKRSSPESRIYVTGYPVFVDDESQGSSCAENVKLNLEEKKFIAQTTRYMNTVVETAAREAGVFYVDVENILSNVNLCSGAADEDMAFNGITLGNDILGLIGNETYHPNNKAHKHYKNKILQETTNLSAAMGQPQGVVETVPLPQNYFPQSIIDAVYEIGRSEVAEITAAYEAIVGNSEVLIDEVRIIKRNLLPGAEIVIEEWSEPVELGRFVVDESGTLDVTVPLASESGPGAHTIHLYGYDRYGSALHSYQPVYVAHSVDDFDGDGVTNDADSCKVIYDSGIDNDADDIDDACDNEVIANEPPPEPPKAEHPICKVLRKIESRLPKFLRPMVYLLYYRFDCKI